MTELKELIEMRNNGDITEEDYSQIKSILIGKNTNQDDENGEEEKKQKEEEEKKHKKKLLELLEWLVKNKKEKKEKKQKEEEKKQKEEEKKQKEEEEKKQKEEEEKKQKEITEWFSGADGQPEDIDQRCIIYDHHDLLSMRELRDDEEQQQFCPTDMRVLNPTLVLDWNNKKAVEKKKLDERKKKKKLDEWNEERNEKKKLDERNEKKKLDELNEKKCILLPEISSELLSAKELRDDGYRIGIDGMHVVFQTLRGYFTILKYQNGIYKVQE